jgi:hypothetical protein
MSALPGALKSGHWFARVGILMTRRNGDCCPLVMNIWSLMSLQYSGLLTSYLAIAFDRTGIGLAQGNS